MSGRVGHWEQVLAMEVEKFSMAEGTETGRMSITVGMEAIGEERTS